MGATTDSVFDEISRAERLLEKSFETDTGIELKLADRAASLLAVALSSVAPLATLGPGEVQTPRSGGAKGLMLFALQAMGVRALRVIRAARCSLASGYEPESLAHDRILIEFVAHRKEVLEDGTGGVAKAWLEAETGRGMAKRVAKVAPDGLYGFLSRSSHGDPRPLGYLADYTKQTFQLAPQRTGLAKVCLLFYAMFATDQAAMIAAISEVELPGHSDLRDAIQARVNEVWEASEA